MGEEGQLGRYPQRVNTYTWTAGGGDFDGTITTEFLAALNAGSGFAGHTDWRIPNITEIESLRNFGARIPAAFSEFNTDCAAGMHA